MQNSPAIETWEAALGDLQVQLPRSTYETWLKNTKGLELDGTTLLVGVPNSFTAEWLEKRIFPLIQRTVCSVSKQTLAVKFTTIPADSAPTALLQGSAAPPHAPPQWAPNQRYSFESFIVGPSNKLPYNAAWGVAQAPGSMYNPLFIHSGVGLGKTHLLHAIARHCTAQMINCLYVTSERFTNDFISSIKRKTTEEFRAKYRSVDVLLMDDVQFLAGKEQTQEGFFHTFNDLHDSNRQVILASDQPPQNIPALAERLRSRFGWGLIANILPPQTETRVSIIQRRAKEIGIAIEDDAATYIAGKVRDNVRNLEGALNRAVAAAQSAGTSVDLPTTREALQHQDSGALPAVRPADVLTAVANVFGVSTEALAGSSRKGAVSTARQAAMYALRLHANLSITQVARMLGGKNHSTVIYGIKRMASGLDTRAELRYKMSQVTMHLLKAPSA